MDEQSKQFLPEVVLVIDCESIGLYGETYAVAGAVYRMTNQEAAERTSAEFVYACYPGFAAGSGDDRAWCAENIPEIPPHVRNATVSTVREDFGFMWKGIVGDYPGVVLAAECMYPVESGFVSACVKDGWIGKFNGPYPLHEIASFMAAAGMDPMASYDRLPDELPKHDPMADVRQSARLLHTAIWKLKSAKEASV